MISTSDILAARILVVDDLAANVMLLEQMLRGAGYVCVGSTSDPRKVCALHGENHYDLILLDLQMPGLDGFEVMENLKAIQEDSYLPVIVITAQPDHKLRALRAGARDFVSKPFDLGEVLTRVRNMLEVRLLHRQSLQYGEELERKVQELEASRETIVHQSDELRGRGNSFYRCGSTSWASNSRCSISSKTGFSMRCCAPARTSAANLSIHSARLPQMETRGAISAFL
jgi:adenylate cyclase